jgi:catechol 2,3-dioxygenase-like lactoylglutathione lyase family enzyme
MMADGIHGVKSLDAITLVVEDLEAAKTFQETVFGKPLKFEDESSAAYDFGGVVVNLLAVAAAPELVAPAAVGAAGSAPRSVITVAVDDVDAECRRVAEAGLTPLNGPMDRPWGIRTASFQDPAGHVWEIAHPLGR